MVKSLTHQSEKRKQLVVALIKAGKIHSQSDLVRELKDQGLDVTQATASRDLQELGAMRTKGNDGVMKYVLDSASQLPNGSSLILSVASSANTVVLRTPPAAAQFVASTLDAAIIAQELPLAIGTIAGDDTVLVIASAATGGEALAKSIESMFGRGK
jgi:transcriptional regulator of arginine metabolism